jgi:hypothetical protein
MNVDHSLLGTFSTQKAPLSLALFRDWVWTLRTRIPSCRARAQELSGERSTGESGGITAASLRLTVRPPRRGTGGALPDLPAQGTRIPGPGRGSRPG